MKQKKPYWEMTASELRKATRQFDDPEYRPPALPQTAEDEARQQHAEEQGRPAA